MVYQDLALVDAAKAVETNLTLGREPVRRGPLGWLGILDKKAMRREAARELEALGVTTAPVTRPVEMLSGGQRQVVALARSAVRVPRSGVLLLDEPTAALGYAQTKQVEQLIRRMAERGIGVVVVTHNLPLCSRWPIGSSCSTGGGRSPTSRPPRRTTTRWSAGSPGPARAGAPPPVA